MGLLGTSGKRGNNLDEGVFELMVEDSVEMGGTVKGPTDDATCKVFLILLSILFSFCLHCPQRGFSHFFWGQFDFAFTSAVPRDFFVVNFNLVFTSAVPRDQSAPSLAPLQDDNCCVVDCRHLERKN